ncbi:hypothetical protein D9613_000224 [Agrocybe pediades]|uniref:Transmembrane protein n=1 Tax=Agrocybe pediades TaxID=84607 RepID=A0A8H4R1Q7_9AGAR|nr:hypothetical protein D9613_000224 [Agrocybe pediades]
MPSLVTVVEDTSPILLYSANDWKAGTSSSDTLADQYTLSSFTLTKTSGASLHFPFFGNSVQVYGAKRANHGVYVAQLDGSVSPPMNGSSSSDLFQQLLYSSDVPLGVHSLTVTNQDNAFFDVDYVTFKTIVGTDNEDLIVNAYQDSHPAFNYTPSAAWSTSPTMVGTFSGGTGHSTSSPSAVGVLKFEVRYMWSLFLSDHDLISRPAGDAVTLYGPVGPGAANTYSVTVDNGSPFTFSAKKQFYRPQQILYTTSGLGKGNHSLRIQLGGDGGELAIDYANVYTTKSLGGSFLEIAPTSSSKSSKLPGGTIAAIVILTLISIFSSLCCAYLLRRQNQLKKQIRRRSVVKDFESKIVQPYVLPPPPPATAINPISQAGRDYDIYGRSRNESAYAFSTPAPSTNPPSTAPASNPAASAYYPQEKRGNAAAYDEPAGQPSGYNTRGYGDAYGELPTAGLHPPPQYMPGNSRGHVG